MPQEIDISLRDYYERFVDEILTSGIVWGLKNDAGWAICDSNDFEGQETIPFWSNENQAKKLCIDEWHDYQPSPIHFDDFIDAWLHGMHEDEVLAGINWDEELVGPEIEPVMLIEDLLEGE